MSPLNPSPSSQPSSNSTTPPSETTFADEVLIPETPKYSINAQTSQQKVQKSEPVCQDQIINTDYESSAAEDLETFSKADSKYENAECALLSYSRTNKLDKLKALLDAKLKDEISLDLNYKGQQKQNYSWSALHLACYFGHKQVVDYLLSKKPFREEININVQNHSGDTPLHKATLTNRVELVQLLLSNGANVFIKNCDGLLAKQLINNKHILDMLKAAEQVDKTRIRQDMFKAVDNGDLDKLQEYLKHYSYYIEASGVIDNLNAVEEKGQDTFAVDNESDRNLPSGNQAKKNLSSNELISQMTDERGNTLLHLAAMRGFKAICVYLLEQGFDPYRKNALSQTCIDLSSYQLRQLFTTVKPALSQLKRISSQRVTRFEGSLLKKVRILGWKQTYVVLENGVFLLFNNRKDSMNKARRGYKYLESATCDPDDNDLGMFTICFSDKSRATFLVTSDHLNNHTYFRPTTRDYDKNVAPTNHIELIRQKWIDSIRDHIRYSTDFIKSGLKFNDDDDDEGDNFTLGDDISNLNHLLPIDTIKSFIQEARAHYSILNRHADSLCNLVKSINNSASRANNSFESSSRDDESKAVENNPPSNNASPDTGNASTGSRLLGFIRPSRQSRVNSVSTDDASINQNPQPLSNNSSRSRNNSLTNEFIQDNWHCILFHLRLLIESSENTKISMGQALALLEHQEQLRQNRIQDQEERCRVLEDSLHALARDHHELEKSLSMSQVYHSVATRSMSMSTDLNEYFDAFEDFDDEKTMTPTSMPSDEDIKKKIQDVINEPGMNDEQDNRVFADKVSNQLHRLISNRNCQASSDEDEDDLQSNCSALTVETISEQTLIGTTGIIESSTGARLNLQASQQYR